jgi:hypothetical protein
MCIWFPTCYCVVPELVDISSWDIKVAFIENIVEDPMWEKDRLLLNPIAMRNFFIAHWNPDVFDFLGLDSKTLYTPKTNYPSIQKL